MKLKKKSYKRKSESNIPNSFIFNLLRELIEDTVSTPISRIQKQPRLHALLHQQKSIKMEKIKFKKNKKRMKI